jgi:hypothetical protein
MTPWAASSRAGCSTAWLEAEEAIEVVNRVVQGHAVDDSGI